MEFSCREIADMIDHSLLKPELTDNDVREGCRLAKHYGVAAVCCNPAHVPLVREELAGSGVKTDAVVGFPHGYAATRTKVYEAEQAIADGAEELDLVINIGKLRSGETEYVKNDIAAVVETAHDEGVIVKVILENCYLTDGQKKQGCRLAEEAGADFVKTSTGFGTGGATTEDLQLMLETVSDSVKVKAAGGIRSLDRAIEIGRMGVVRFGATRTESIMEECRKRSSP
jgi:deoxyribose-phosphate aldolase